MAVKDYFGKCGACKFCDLSSGSTFCYTTKFDCTRFRQSVKADENGCNKFEPAPGRTNEIIAKYDK
ncbi:MAG: hypothetical protein E7452_06915 [Ruminococcaceae bacterium]|nr:hypothetical protein [Oscillospiraceae bacterium]